jgi:hypothetical protein
LIVFAVLWASALLFDQGKWDEWSSTPANLALSASAFWLLFRPWSSIALALMAVFSIAVTVERAPWLSNHWVLATLACLTILIAFGRTLRDSSEQSRHQRLFEDFSPALRLELLAFYGWTVFHKLNTDYLDPVVSCASTFYHELVARFSVLPATGWAGQAAIYNSLAFELAIPVLLVSRRTRWAGLLIACAFHFILGAIGFFNFSAYMLALLALFLPQGSIALVLQNLRSSASTRRLFFGLRPGTVTTTYLWATRALFTIALLVLLSQFSPNSGGEPTRLLALPFEGRRSVISRGVEAIWWVWAPIVTAFFFATLRATTGEWPPATRLLRLSSPLYVVPILLLVLNGASPYLGFKTEHSFAMFSNLRTEGEGANHLILRHGALWGGYQDDLVAVETSTDEELQRLADNGYLLPWFEFRSHLSRRVREIPGPVTVEYLRMGERYAVDARSDAELRRPDPRWARKILNFRPVAAGGKSRCIH